MMQSAIPMRDTISGCRRVTWAAAFGLLLVFVQTVSAQNASNQLSLFKNYFVTGDYVVGGVGLRGRGGIDGFAQGTINIPDPDQNSVSPGGVPPGADIVAAFLYWESVEKSQSQFAGQRGFFNGHQIIGTVLGNPNAPTSWSSGGCAGSSNGTTTLRTYRSDVRPFLPLDPNGKVQANGSYEVRLADSGSNGGGTPLTLGATLVMIYRVLSPAAPLTSIILYDGAVAPSNSSSTMSQAIQGFYQAASTTKITHIVGDGQPNKFQSVFLNNVNLPSLYPGLPPFPGHYNGSWDNPTWTIGSGAVNSNDSSATTSVVPTGNGGGCVDWGAVIFSTTVQDTDRDGLLDVWETNQGYTDVITGQSVALPKANPNVKDLFVEIDYLSSLGTGTGQHSHLPKQAALDQIGNAFKNSPVDCNSNGSNCKGVQVHFDVGINYQTPMPGGPSVQCGTATCDPYIISGGAGGNGISESSVACSSASQTATSLCEFPDQPVVSWKAGFASLKAQNFAQSRKDSYHYLLSGHTLGMPASSWAASGVAVPSLSRGTLVAIVDSGTTATVTIISPPGLLKPGEPPPPPPDNFTNLDRVTIKGAIGQTLVSGAPVPNANLNGTYPYTISSQSADSAGNVTQILTITTANVPDGTYSYAKQPGLAVVFGGPKSTSGFSDLGGGDSSVTLGLWRADDPSACQVNPAISLIAGQAYCNDQVGNTTVQAGTIMHEFGHTLALTHGGMYFANANNNPPSAPTFGLNAKPNFLSVMNYLFQIRGFGDGGIDYSGRTHASRSEDGLNEATGLNGPGFPAAVHFTRWYAPPNAIDIQLESTAGGRFATRHGDGTPIGPNEPPMVRVDGDTFSAPIDWNNNLTVPDTNNPLAPQDVNFNGIVGDAPFQGFSDWQSFDPRQIGARRNASGFSGNVGGLDIFGGGLDIFGGGLDIFGGGLDIFGGGLDIFGGGLDIFGGGSEFDFEMANSDVDPPTGLSAAPSPLSTHYVQLNWTAPAFGQIRTYYIWRAEGRFPTLKDVLANLSKFSNIDKVTGSPPLTTFTDKNVKNRVWYTYFVTNVNKQSRQSGASQPTTILVRF